MDIRSLFLQLPVVLFSLYGNSLDWTIIVVHKTYRNWQYIRLLLQDLASQIGYPRLALTSSAFIALFTTIQLFRCVKGFQISTSIQNGFPSKPMLFPGRTAHTRFFPKKHHFSYPFLTVGVPVGFRGIVGGMISVDQPAALTKWYLRLVSLKPWSAWFTVSGDDYLARGHVEGGLEEKLRDFLKIQGEDSELYSHAYLLTPPRVFGYYSNPVSIWHLYSPHGILSAMILEVNNTFDERHSYFVKRSPISSDAETLPDSKVDGRFHHSWPKDFHVSVFNSRSGSYSISASDPLSPSMKGEAILDETITLSSSKNHPKLVARVFSTSPALDPAAMTLSEKLNFLSKWWWVGFATFPRTIVQAVTILSRIGLNWVARPEPRQKTLPRDADNGELVIETAFRRYLRKTVERCPKALVVSYIPAGTSDTVGEMMYSPAAQVSDKAEEVQVRVLTPLFYSRFVGYNSVLEALTSEHFENQTINISHFESFKRLDFSVNQREPKRARRETAYLFLLRLLRKSPGPIVNAETNKLRALRSSKDRLATPARLRSNSEFDFFVLAPRSARSSNDEKRDYTRVLLKLFLAQYVASGSTALLDLEIWIIRVAAVYWIAGHCLD